MFGAADDDFGSIPPYRLGRWRSLSSRIGASAALPAAAPLPRSIMEVDLSLDGLGDASEAAAAIVLA